MLSMRRLPVAFSTQVLTGMSLWRQIVRLTRIAIATGLPPADTVSSSGLIAGGMQMNQVLIHCHDRKNEWGEPVAIPLQRCSRIGSSGRGESSIIIRGYYGAKLRVDRDQNRR